MGATEFTLPPNVGFRMGSGSSHGVKRICHILPLPTDIIIEMHYNNPENIANIVDNSGVAITYTTELRQYHYLLNFYIADTMQEF